MATNRFCIETFMQQMGLQYFKSEQTEPVWIVMLTPSTWLMLQLGEEGGSLIFRSLPVVDRKILSEEKQNRLNAALLKLNQECRLGRYCGDEEIVIEGVLPIADAELTAAQFQQCVATVSDEAINFKKRLPELVGDVPPANGPVRRAGLLAGRGICVLVILWKTWCLIV
jgi:hypothetical protein